MTDIRSVVDLRQHPLESESYRQLCKDRLDRDGFLVLSSFLSPEAVADINREGDEQKNLAYYTKNTHNIFLSPPDQQLALSHPRNRQVVSSKGCITTDQIPEQSKLKLLYASDVFRQFLAAVLDESELHEYADPLSSINLHYAAAGQELGWHFDNSSFAITLLVQKPQAGGEFQFVRDVRNYGNGETNFDDCAAVLDGRKLGKTLHMEAGDLVLFRGQNSMHRVTPVVGDRLRKLVVLAYNTRPGISLSESARMTFYGRLV